MKAKLSVCPFCINGSGFTAFLPNNSGQNCTSCNGTGKIKISELKRLELDDCIKPIENEQK